MPFLYELAACKLLRLFDMARNASPKTRAGKAAPEGLDEIVAGDDSSEHELVEVTSSVENWSVYTLADGTIVRVKPIIAEFIKVIGKFNEEGEPIYMMKGGMVPSLRVPKRLMRKP